ncbi:cyclase family protein [Geotalea sp. SG265]|uniref:cyclase family protein n=1 Tax=Geotalea sp. SG265 TaxID=2922867 RepID=UPI001FAE8CE3|nr:cyclase family protein [Geotalea sp. SG265]
MRIYDISRTISERLPVYPGDPPVRIEPVMRLDLGEMANVSAVSMCSHSGTHIDVPRHCFEDGLSVDLLPLGQLIGNAVVVEAAGAREIGREQLKRLPVKGEERVLLKTGATYAASGEPAYLTEEGAEFLLESGAKLVGTDALSIEGEGGLEVHRLLLRNDILIVEGLRLEEVPAGHYQLICLPMKLADGDGAPVRAVLIGRDAVGEGEFDPHTSKWPLS